MASSRLQQALVQVASELKELEGRRERLLRESRDVLANASRAIVNTHTARLRDAQANVSAAERLLRGLRPLATDRLSRYLVPPETEYVEAAAFLALTRDRPLPSYAHLGVSNAAYLLGLLDAIGEAKRLVYDRIRVGATSEAARLFRQMEELYLHLAPFAIYDHVATGVKRKLDVARAIVEDTRALITEEQRRSQLAGAMEKLSRRLRRR